MARVDILEALYSRQASPEFDFDMLSGPRILQLLSPYDLDQLYKINTDPRLHTKLKKRLELSDSIMMARGFQRMTQGTNRAVYKYLEDQSFVIKIPISRNGLNDSAMEAINQQKIKPFVAKCFDVAPTGVGCFERVDPITSAEQFKSIAEDVYDLLFDHILGKWVMADIGTKTFRNYGLRHGFGPVLLDYPMLYEVDGNKLYCSHRDYMTGQICGGEIDYDAGANELHCTKCGKTYLPSELEKKIECNEILIRDERNEFAKRRKSKMEIKLGGKTIMKEEVCSSETYVNKHRNSKKEEAPASPNEIRINVGEQTIKRINTTPKIESYKVTVDDPNKEKQEETEVVAVEGTSTTELHETPEMVAADDNVIAAYLKSKANNLEFSIGEFIKYISDGDFTMSALTLDLFKNTVLGMIDTLDSKMLSVEDYNDTVELIEANKEESEEADVEEESIPEEGDEESIESALESKLDGMSSSQQELADNY